jgi:hypothetical protein
MVNKIVRSSGECPLCQGKAVVYVWQKNRRAGAVAPEKLPCGCTAKSSSKASSKGSAFSQSVKSLKRLFLRD